MTEDDDTQGRRMRTESNPAIYLHRQQMNDDETALMDALGLHAGASVPAHMFIKLVVIVHELKAIAARVMTGWRIIRWIGVPLIGAVITNATCVGKAAYEAHDVRVAAEQQRVDDQRAFQVYRDGVEKEIAEMRLDIRELRSMLRKMTGAEPGPVSSSAAFADSGFGIVTKGAP